MNRQPRRKANSRQSRALHKISSEVAFGFSPVVFSEPAPVTKVVKR